MKGKRPKCLMCEAPGKVIEARKPGPSYCAQVYVNATTLPVFCSLRCAANYALLWVEGLESDRLTERGHRLPGGFLMKPLRPPPRPAACRA